MIITTLKKSQFQQERASDELKTILALVIYFYPKEGKVILKVMMFQRIIQASLDITDLSENWGKI